MCDVVRYDIAKKTGTVIPNTFGSGRLQWQPAVTSAGTVYFIHENRGSQCGRSVMLVRSPVGGSNTVLVRFKKDYDVISTFADDSTGAPVVYFDRYRCGNPAGDIYKVID